MIFTRLSAVLLIASLVASLAGCSSTDTAPEASGATNAGGTTGAIAIAGTGGNATSKDGGAGEPAATTGGSTTSATGGDGAGAGGGISSGGGAGTGGGVDTGGGAGTSGSGGTGGVAGSGGGPAGGGVAGNGGAAGTGAVIATLETGAGKLGVVGAAFANSLGPVKATAGSHLIVVTLKFVDSSGNVSISQLQALLDELQNAGVYLLNSADNSHLPFAVSVTTSQGPTFQIPSPVPLSSGSAFKLVWPPNAPVDLSGLL